MTGMPCWYGAALLAAATLSRAPVQAADWPQFRGPRGDGICTETGWTDRFGPEGPPVTWQKQVGIGYAAVSVADGRLLTAGWADGRTTVHCLDARTGASHWDFAYAVTRHDKQHVGGPAATPAIGDGRVYTLSREGELFCLDLRRGDRLWSKDLAAECRAQKPSFGFTGSPVVYGDVVYVDVGPLVALDRASGELRWQSKDYGSAYSTPVPFTARGRSLIAAFPRFGLVVIEAATGQTWADHAWENRWGNNAATPIVAGDRIFVSSGDNAGGIYLEVGQRTLSEVWRNGQMRNQMATCVQIDGHLYGFDEAVLKCLRLGDGQVQWKQRGLGRGTLLAGDGKLVVLSEDGELVIADATSDRFRVRSRAQVLDADRCWTVPVLADGRLYCRSSQGQLVCLDLRPPEP